MDVVVEIFEIEECYELLYIASCSHLIYLQCTSWNELKNVFFGKDYVVMRTMNCVWGICGGKSG